MNLIADQQMEDGADAEADCQSKGTNNQIFRFNATNK